jgi:hypothetical protein
MAHTNGVKPMFLGLVIVAVSLFAAALGAVSLEDALTPR